ncbi:MAG: TatD family hydrolase, partial [Clostridia bacterium]|nr:TatD family hydrolase [Clostridia bacterium]
MFTDTHCHFAEHEGYDKDGAYARALENKVDLMIDVAFDVASSFQSEKFAKDKENVYFLAGIHPDAFEEVTEENLALIKPIFSNPKCVGVGEIGLDYHYGKDKDGQKSAFVRQIVFANELKLPFSVHSRDCTEDMVN